MGFRVLSSFRGLYRISGELSRIRAFHRDSAEFLKVLGGFTGFWVRFKGRSRGPLEAFHGVVQEGG